jgi:hypothetical protein
MIKVETPDHQQLLVKANADTGGGSRNLASSHLLQNVKRAEEYGGKPIPMVNIHGDSPAYTHQGQDEKRKYDNMVVQYENAMIFLRELLNHTFLRAIYYTSTRQAPSEYKEVQGTCVTQNALS